MKSLCRLLLSISSLASIKILIKAVCSAVEEGKNYSCEGEEKHWQAKNELEQLLR
jgi:hypothetical protein